MVKFCSYCTNIFINTTAQRNTEVTNLYHVLFKFCIEGVHIEYLFLPGCKIPQSAHSELPLKRRFVTIYKLRYPPPSEKKKSLNVKSINQLSINQSSSSTVPFMSLRYGGTRMQSPKF